MSIDWLQIARDVLVSIPSVGAGALGASIAIALDKSIVTLKPGQVVVDGEELKALRERASVASNPLRHSSRATFRRPENDFGDDEDDDD